VTPISIITVGARYRMLFDRNHPKSPSEIHEDEGSKSEAQEHLLEAVIRLNCSSRRNASLLVFEGDVSFRGPDSLLDAHKNPAQAELGRGTLQSNEQPNHGRHARSLHF